MRRFTGFGAGNGGFNGRFTRIDRCRLYLDLVRLRGFTGFRTGNSGFNSRFTRINGGRFYVSLVRLRCLTGFSAGNSSLDGRFTRIRFWLCGAGLGLLGLTGTSLCFTRFARGNGFAIVRALTRWDHHILSGGGFLLANTSQGGINGVLIFRRRLNRCFFMTFFAGGFFSLQTQLAGFKACFGLGSAFLFLGDGVNLGLFDAEILHQRNIARANPGAGTAFNAVGQVMGFCFVVDLTFAVPVKLLGQQIRRTGIGAGAAAYAAFLFLFLAHLADGRGQQTVGNFHHRDIQPRQGKAH